MKLFDFSLKFNGFDIDKAKTTFEEITSISEEDYSTYISIKKSEIVQFHITNNTFYKNLVTNSDVKNWNSLPVITKRDLQQPLESRLSKGFNKKNCYINKTSGSSGNPFIFAKCKSSHALSWVEFYNRYSWYEIDFNTTKQARFYGIPLDKFGYYKERFKDWLGNRYRFSVFDLSDDALEKVLQKFKSTDFHYINGYTSPIVQFAKFLKQKSIVLKDVCPTLDVCIVTSEMLFDSDKKLMESQFNVPVVNEYGASELGLIAFENPEKEFVINSEALFVEILDDNNNPLPNGEEGRIVITSLYNKAHPFIRYDIGDIGIIDKSSTAKKPILKKLTGRTNDFAILPSGKKAAGLTFYYVTKTIIENDSLVKEFTIEQLKPDTFVIKYVCTEELSNSKKDDIIKAMKEYLEPEIFITFEKHQVLQRNKRGKLKQFSSQVK